MTRLELAASYVTGRRSNQLSYTPTVLGSWWAKRGSNPRHLPCKGSALPTELFAHVITLSLFSSSSRKVKYSKTLLSLSIKNRCQFRTHFQMIAQQRSDERKKIIPPHALECQQILGKSAVGGRQSAVGSRQSSVRKGIFYHGSTEFEKTQDWSDSLMVRKMFPSIP